AMVAINPHILLFDPSFQLSVIATAGLVSFGDVVYGWLPRVPQQFGIREMATATITAQIAVTPLLLYYTGMFSTVSLLANLLVLPVIPILMTAAALTAISGLLAQNFALPFAGIAYAVAEYVFTVVDLLTSLEFSTVSIENISLLMVFLSYVCLVTLFIALQNGYFFRTT
ncbi:MAG: ComEC/Rec2 family competence protein, partial [Actinobacteria bacterium]|nr:ComEC/Rec2 family competence protein [Actinomycetota bacterium]